MICFGDTSDMTGSALDLGKKGTEESRLVLVFTIGPPLSIQQTKGRAHLEGSHERARWRWLLHIRVEVTTEQTRTLSWESGVLSEDEERVGSMHWSLQQRVTCQRRKAGKQEVEKEGEKMGGQRRSLTFKG